MNNFVAYEIIASYFAGAITVILIFHRQIFYQGIDISIGFTTRELNKLEAKFYNILSSSVDLSLYNNTLNAIELERRRIGTDVHDELATHLSSLKLDIDVVAEEVKHISIMADELLTKMRSKVANTVVMLRNIIHGILPPELQEGITEALRELCRKHDGTKGTTILFRTAGQPTELNDLQNLHLYRIFQELLTNCFKHSLAWSIFVEVLWSKNELIIRIKDTGIGMPKFIQNIDKFGITGIFARSKAIGATARFNTPTKGTEFELKLPLHQQHR